MSTVARVGSASLASTRRRRRFAAGTEPPGVRREPPGSPPERAAKTPFLTMGSFSLDVLLLGAPTDEAPKPRDAADRLR